MNQDFIDLLRELSVHNVEFLVVGAPLQDFREEDLAQPGVIFRIGAAPIRIDILTEIDGVEFSDAWNERVPTLLGGQTVFVLSRRHVIANKRATGRGQDLADVEQLEKLGEGERA